MSGLQWGERQNESGLVPRHDAKSRWSRKQACDAATTSRLRSDLKSKPDCIERDVARIRVADACDSCTWFLNRCSDGIRTSYQFIHRNVVIRHIWLQHFAGKLLRCDSLLSLSDVSVSRASLQNSFGLPVVDISGELANSLTVGV